MESFFRYISYVDYYQRGERNKNVGFLRWKLYNGEHQIEVQIKDVNCPKGTYLIREKKTEKTLGEITIDKGIGTFVKTFPSLSASGELYVGIYDDRLYLSDVEGFVIPLNPNEYLEVPVKLEVVKKAGRSEAEKQEVHRNNKSNYEKSMIRSKEIFEEGNVIQKKFADECIDTEEVPEAKAASENVLIEGIEEKYMEPVYEREVEEKISLKKEDRIAAKEDFEIIQNKENGKKQISSEKLKIIEPVHDDKWKQLCRQYPTVHPFQGKKVFVSIKPEDFIVLQKEYQKLVHNSFLLHGFYNYGHMILGKLTEEEEAPFYIGVPGVYYEQEKRAAQLFGFVGFESVEQPVQPGSYGYYMVEVEI